MSTLKRTLLAMLCILPRACNAGRRGLPIADESRRSAGASTRPRDGLTTKTTLCAGNFAMATPAGAAAVTVAANNVGSPATDAARRARPIGPARAPTSPSRSWANRRHAARLLGQRLPVRRLVQESSASPSRAPTSTTTTPTRARAASRTRPGRRHSLRERHRQRDQGLVGRAQLERRRAARRDRATHQQHDRRPLHNWGALSPPPTTTPSPTATSPWGPERAAGPHLPERLVRLRHQGRGRHRRRRRLDRGT